MAGPKALDAVLAQLEGFEAPAAAWESEILPARLADYDPDWLDERCLAGYLTWMRLRPRGGAGDKKASPLRTTPIAILPRQGSAMWTSLSSEANGVRPSTRAEMVSYRSVRPKPWLRYSRLAVLAASASPLASRDWFLQFHAKACIRFTPPIRRLPSAQYPGIRQIYPRGYQERRGWHPSRKCALRDKRSSLAITSRAPCRRHIVADQLRWHRFSLHAEIASPDAKHDRVPPFWNGSCLTSRSPTRIISFLETGLRC